MDRRRRKGLAALSARRQQFGSAGGGSAAARLEEAFEQACALLGEEAAFNGRGPVARRLIEHPCAVPDAAALLVTRAEHQPRDAGVADRPRAHGARLERDKEL